MSEFSTARAQQPAPLYAPPDRYRLGAGFDLGYDSNVLRLPGNVSPSAAGAGERPRGSTLTRAFANFSGELPISRQKLYGRAEVARHWFLEYGYLDHVSVQSEIGARWQLGNRLSGNLAYQYDRMLAGLADFRATERNLRMTQQVRATFEVETHPRWRLYAGARGLTARASATPLAQSDLRQATGELGLTYRASGENFVRGLAGVTRGEYPNRAAGGAFDTRFDQYDYAAELFWAISTASTLRGRLGYTDRRHPDVPQRDFRGPTGDLHFAWAPSGKTGLALAVRREIGLFEDVDASYLVSTILSLAPYYELTPRLRLEGAVERWLRRYPGDPQFVASARPERRDTIDLARVALRWIPARTLEWRLGYQWSTRSSNRPDLDFEDHLVFLRGEVGF